MKKIFILGIALALGMSACSLFGPVPTPWDAYPYRIEAKVANADGAVLCPLILPGYPDEYQGWPTSWDAISMLDEEVFVAVPFGAGKTAKVFIETTLPSWTLYDQEDWLTNPTDYMVDAMLWDVDGNFVGFGGFEYFDPDASLNPTVYKDGNVLSLYYPTKADPLFKVSWVDPCFTFLDWKDADISLGFRWPGFNGNITVERIDPYFFGEVQFSVKGVDQWHHGSRYTAFRVVFGTPESAVDMIMASLVKPTSGALSNPDNLNLAVLDKSEVWHKFVDNTTFMSYLTLGVEWSADDANATVTPAGAISWISGTTPLKFTLKVKTDEVNFSMGTWSFVFDKVEKTKGFVYP